MQKATEQSRWHFKHARALEQEPRLGLLRAVKETDRQRLCVASLIGTDVCPVWKANAANQLLKWGLCLNLRPPVVNNEGLQYLFTSCALDQMLFDNWINQVIATLTLKQVIAKLCNTAVFSHLSEQKVGLLHEIVCLHVQRHQKRDAKGKHIRKR